MFGAMGDELQVDIVVPNIGAKTSCLGKPQVPGRVQDLVFDVWAPGLLGTRCGRQRGTRT